MASENGSFTLKQLEVRVTLRAGEFAGGGNTKIITGVPLRARIEKTGPPDFCKATIEARGLRYEDMEKLSTLAFRPLFTARNAVQVYAGDERDGLSLAFSGEITQASADFNAAPDVSFTMEAMTGWFGAPPRRGRPPCRARSPRPTSSPCRRRNWG